MCLGQRCDINWQPFAFGAKKIFLQTCQEKGKLGAFSLALLSDGKIFPGFPLFLSSVRAEINVSIKLFLDRHDFFLESP